MPNYKTHDRINLALLIPIVSILLYYHFEILSVILFSFSYLFSTFYLSPDMDTKSKSYYRWNIFRIFWWPYRRIMTHRGISHNIFLGAAVFMLYCLPLIVAIVILSHSTVPLELLFGFVTAYNFHIIIDKIF